MRSSAPVRFLAFCVAVGLVGYLGLAGYLFAMQRSYIYFPEAQRPNVQASGLPSLQEVELSTSDGLNLLAWFASPPAGKPVVIYFHGNAGSLGGRRDWAALFLKSGLGVLMPEYRGYGGNPGRPTEEGLYADALAAMAFLQARGIPPEQIVLFGESLGTGVATRIAAEQSVAAVILYSPYTSLVAVAASQYWFLPLKRMMRDQFDSLSRIQKVRAPLMVLVGDRDRIVPAALSRELFAAASEPKELWAAPNGGHINLLKFGADKAVLDFLKRHRLVEE